MSRIRDQGGPVLPVAPPAKPLLSTQAYAKQLADADALIDKSDPRQPADRAARVIAQDAISTAAEIQ